MALSEQQELKLLEGLTGNGAIQALLEIVHNFPEYDKPPQIKLEKDADELSLLLSSILETRQVANDTRLQITRPLDDKKGFFIDWFDDEILNRLDLLEGHIRKACEKYLTRQGEKARREQDRAAERLEERRKRLEDRADVAEENGKHDRAMDLRIQAGTLVAALVGTTITKVSGLQKRTKVGYEVVDEALIPREFLIIDHTLVLEKVRALGEHAEDLIPGIKVTNTTSVASVEPV